MASNLFLSNTGASTAINNLGNQFNSGFIDLYAGTQPANANTNTSGAEFILAECTFSTVPGTVVTSTWTAQAMVATTCTSTGICTFYRAITSSRVAILDGSFSTASADMNANTNNFVQGASAQVTTFILILPEH